MSSSAHASAGLSSLRDAPETPPPPAEPVIYPPVTHPLSPTWNSWIKLTSYEIHHVLRPVPANFASLSYSNAGRAAEPTSPAAFHYINHPIRFVSVAGVVVEVNEYNAKYYIFYLDDSSGETIEVVCPRPEDADTVLHGADGGGGVSSHQVLPPPPSAGASSKIDPVEVRLHRLLRGLEVGTVLKVKGHVTTFRSYRQLRIYRAQEIRHTNDEAAFWSAMHAFHDTVLAKPWVLTDQDVAKAKADAHRRVQRLDEEFKRRNGREERRRRKLEDRWALEERKRAEEAEKVRVEAREVMNAMGKRRRDADACGSEVNADTVTADKRRIR